MSTRLLFPVLVTGLALASCAQPTPEQQFINDAADALGGRSRIEAAKTLTLEGEGTNYNLGQDMKPDAATQQFAISGYKRQIDIVNARQRVEQTRTPKFAFFQGPQPQKQIQGLDDQVAFNVNPAGVATRLGAAAELDRRYDLYHHPLKLVRSMMDPTTTVSNVRLAGTGRQADIKTAAGPTLTLSLDAAGVPLSISSKTYNANLGDVVITTTFADYQDVNGFKLPARFAGKVDDFTTWEIHATKQGVDADVGDLAAPRPADKPEGLSPPVTPAPTVTVEPIGKGVWFLAGQSHHSVLVEFSDHLMLIEAPQSEARTLAVIAKAKETVPGKPLTQLVTTHHHFDHTAGLRAAIAEGMTVITQSGNRAWVEAMAKRSHTMPPDTLAKNPKPVTVDTVDEDKEFKDAAMALTLYHVAANPHSDTMLMAYLPRDRVIVEVDAFSLGSSVNPYAANLLQNIEKRKLRVDRIVALHGTIAKLPDLEKVGR
jgi:glyoxylase-like metal-dependent hydrolase (beta-lactamase superfamily II)